MAKKATQKATQKVINAVIGVGTASLVTAAIVEQVRRPAEERTWHGTILGFPYDFRPPTPEKVRNSFWNENTSEIFVPHAFGLGWSINFYPFFHPKPISQ
jgi:hypothetical protein